MTDTNSEARIIAEIDCSTNTTVYREMTQEEIDAQNQIAVESQAFQLERQAKIEAIEALKASAKAKLVAGEPLTPEEAATIVL